jgi:hypothetical protein
VFEKDILCLDSENSLDCGGVALEKGGCVSGLVYNLGVGLIRIVRSDTEGFIAELRSEEINLLK